jgi:hypothetical protein
MSPPPPAGSIAEIGKQRADPEVLVNVEMT